MLQRLSPRCFYSEADENHINGLQGCQKLNEGGNLNKTSLKNKMYIT